MPSKSPLESQRARMIANLQYIYLHASRHARADGIDWYPRQRAIMTDWAATYHLPVAVVANVVAAISPQCEWERNLVIADDVLAERAPSIGGALHVNVAKARTLIDGYHDGTLTGTVADMRTIFPSGPKVNSFAANLAGDDTAVTIDTHAVQAAHHNVELRCSGPSWTPYRIYAECYTEAAGLSGHVPSTFQAIIWCAWKEQYPRVDKIRRRSQW